MCPSMRRCSFVGQKISFLDNNISPHPFRLFLPLIRFGLFLDISADVLLRNTSYRLNVIGMVLQFSFPQWLPEVWVCLEGKSSDNPLEHLDDIGDRYLGRSGYETVDMVSVSCLEQMDREAFLFPDLDSPFPHRLLHVFCDYFPAILYWPYHMVINIVYASSCMYQIFFHTYSISQSSGKSNRFFEHIFVFCKYNKK